MKALKISLISLAVVVILFLGYGISAWLQPSTSQERINELEIRMYISEDEFMLDALEVYKENWENQEGDFLAKSSGGLFGGGRADSIRWKKYWYPTMQSIDSAIYLRKLINDKKFAQLKYYHFSKQPAFNAAIHKISAANVEEVKNRLGTISTWTLAQITHFINGVVSDLPEVSQTTLAVSSTNVTIGASGDRKTIAINTDAPDYQIVNSPVWCKIESKNSTSFTLLAVKNNSVNERYGRIIVKANDKEVVIHITQMGKEQVRKAEEPKMNPDAEYKKRTYPIMPDSLSPTQNSQKEIADSFWELVKFNMGKKSFEHWWKKWENITSENEYKKFYDKYLKSSKQFNKFMETPEVKRKRAKTLEELENLILELDN